jgi:hypothetical protein
MNLKLSMILSITIVTLVFPTIADSSQVIYERFEFKKSGSVINDSPIFLKGIISNITLHQHSYMVPFYTFDCVDVYCIFHLRDHPMIHHLTNNEQFVLDLYIYKLSRSYIIGCERPFFLLLDLYAAIFHPWSY